MVTLRPCIWRISLYSWLPIRQRALPARVIFMAISRTPGLSGPRSTRSPRNRAVRLLGMGVGAGFVGAVAHLLPAAVSSSSRQPWMSPIRSKGPDRAARSWRLGRRTISARSILIWGVHYIYLVETLFPQAFQRAAEFAALVGDGAAGGLAVGAVGVAFLAGALIEVEHDGDGGAIACFGPVAAGCGGRGAGRWWRRRR